MRIELNEENTEKINKIMNSLNTSANAFVNELISGIQDVDYKLTVQVHLREEYEIKEVQSKKTKPKLRLR